MFKKIGDCLNTNLKFFEGLADQDLGRERIDEASLSKAISQIDSSLISGVFHIPIKLSVTADDARSEGF